MMRGATVVVCLLLAATAVQAIDVAFSIGRMKGGPVHESITYSSFNHVFGKERTSYPHFKTEEKCSEYTKHWLATHSKTSKGGTLAAEIVRDTDKVFPEFKCDELKNHPDVATILRAGTQWNDMPCSDVNAPWSACMVNMVKEFTKASSALEEGKLPPKEDKGSGEKYSIVAESHFGTLQYYHSMAPSGPDFTPIKMTQKDIVDKKIIPFAREMWRDACSYQNRAWALTYIARILHMIQDSYSEAHVVRSKEKFDTGDPEYREHGERTGSVLFFQGYESQDHHKHADLEGLFGTVLGAIKDQVVGWATGNPVVFDYKSVHGAMKARYQCIKVWKMWQSIADADTLLPINQEECMKKEGDLRIFLREEVYKFATVTCKNGEVRTMAEMYAGGSRKDIAKDVDLVELSCAGQTFPSTMLKANDRQFQDGPSAVDRKPHSPGDFLKKLNRR